MTRIPKHAVHPKRQQEEGAPPAAGPANAIEALGRVLQFPQARASESLAESYDLLRLIGAVAAQLEMLGIVTGAGQAKDRVAAARILTKLGEDPATIVERLKSGPFEGLETADLRQLYEDILGRSLDPRTALEEALARKARRA